MKRQHLYNRTIASINEYQYWIEAGGEFPGKEPFYFKSFDRVISVAHNVNELRSEFGRLLNVDPKALEYHLREGHIVQWLEYIGEVELARRLIGISDPGRAYEIINNYLTGSRDTTTEEEPSTRQGRKPSRRSRNSRKT
ncbi:hypothetical protein [Vulcanisaeta sp. JCM 16159]|uniref:hypothetical protein n=1 Tax=Vulcanisaeta sp. JCM 16159 TaxID=1295371 RepID=UPI000AD4DDF1|nr:hypothetical protein [Vulcanisaeta sp. JCM 16159]